MNIPTRWYNLSWDGTNGIVLISNTKDVIYRHLPFPRSPYSMRSDSKGISLPGSPSHVASRVCGFHPNDHILTIYVRRDLSSAYAVNILVLGEIYFFGEQNLLSFFPTCFWWDNWRDILGRNCHVTGKGSKNSRHGWQQCTSIILVAPFEICWAQPLMILTLEYWEI